MSRRGYSVKQAKADVVRDYYSGVEPVSYTHLKIKMKIELDVHTHTIASGHAFSTLQEMAQAAADRCV